MRNTHISNHIKPRSYLKFDDVYEEISNKWEEKARTLRARREHKIKQQSRLMGMY